MGAKVTFKITSKENFKTTDEQYSASIASKFSPTYVEGQITFVEGLQEIYLDFHGYRKCYSTPQESGMNYVGISTTDPTTGTVTIDGEVLQPRLKDVVAYKNKEYLYRNGSSGEGWYEIGDEDSPEWNT